MLMRTYALLPALLLTAALVAQAPAASFGDRLKAERPAVDKLMADLQYPDALKRVESLLPAVKPAFDKTNNQTMVQSTSDYMDLCQTYRLAVEAADAAGNWEKALEYAKTAKALSAESYAAIKEPFTQTVAYYVQAGVRAKQVLEENDARIKELKGKSVLDPGERQELDLAIGVEKEQVDDAKWVKFFQTYLDVTKRESETYDPMVKVMEDKLKGEVNQVEEYKAGKGDKIKWVEAVVSSPAYLEAQGDKAGKARFLYRLAVLDPESRKVQHQLDVLFGRAPATPVKAAKPAKKGKKG